jgi:hypothetical protein
MQLRPLGQTGLLISTISLGCGPVSGLMTGSDPERQLAVVDEAIRSGINWFDTAPGYGDGRSEKNLGRCLAICDPQAQLQIGTKVRLLRTAGGTIREQIRGSVEASLARLQRPSVALLQLHNAITHQPDEQPFSVTPDEILGTGGVADCMAELQREGLIQAAGLTGTGSTEAITTVVRSGRFQTIQLPLNLLHSLPGADPQPLQILAACQSASMSILAIRVFAAGALLGRPPSDHTLRTPFFPLALYERDTAQASEFHRDLQPNELLARAIRYPLSQPAVASAIIGFADAAEVRQLNGIIEAAPAARQERRSPG